MPTLSVQAAAIAGPGNLPDQPEAPSMTSVSAQAQGQGFAFYPSTTQPGAFRLALGAYYDAIDPAVMYGMNFRLPQFSMDARYGLGQGWSLKGHLNTIDRKSVV